MLGLGGLVAVVRGPLSGRAWRNDQEMDLPECLGGLVEV